MRSPKAPTFLCLLIASAIVGPTPLAAAQTGIKPFDDAAKQFDDAAKHFDDAAKGLWDALSTAVNPRMGKIIALLNENKFGEADQYYESERDYFSSLKGDEEAKLASLAGYLNDQLVSKLDAAAADIDSLAGKVNGTDTSNWQTAKSVLSTSDQLRDQYASHSILKRPKFRSAAFGRLDQTTAEFRAGLTGGAEDAFCAFDIFSTRDFATEYPVRIDMTAVVRGGFPKLAPRMAKATPSELHAFNERFGRLLDSGQSQELARIYVGQSLAQNGSTLLAKLRALRDARASGFDGLDIRDLKISLIQLKTTRSDAPQVTLVGSRNDAVVLVDRTGFIEVSAPTQEIVVDFSASTIDRKIISKTEKQSRFVSGQQSVSNPAYENARIRYQAADSDYQQYQANASNNPARGWWALAQAAGSVSMAAARGNAYRDLAATPPTITENVFEDYTYSVSSVASRKVLSANILAIDMGSKQVQHVILNWEEDKQFQLAFNTNEKDTSWRGNYAEEADIDRFEKTPATLSVTKVIDGLLADGTPLANYAAWDTLVALLGPDVPSRVMPIPGTAMAAVDTAGLQVTSLNQSPPNATRLANNSADQIDPRYESVVIVQTPKGVLGTGFYIANDLIITNEHVIEGAGFAEIILSDGRKSFGKVVKSDLNLDLALLRVADPGTPVEFYNAQVVTGATVDVIGHPKGLSYSLSRGIVSAVRKMPNPFVKGGALVTYIQTDAKINPGNSGGPMYLGGKVVGVNTQKMTGRAIEGIGFAVHYAEVLRFLQD